MGRKNIAFVLVFLLTALSAFPQHQDSALAKPLHFSFTVGACLTHYIDNLDYGNQNLSKNFAGISFRFLWEPEYRLSLGAETGIYTMFKVKSPPGSATTGDITRRITPMFLLVRMRVVDYIYLSTGFGLAFLTNTSNDMDQKIVTKTTSLSNYLFSATYIYPISKHWQLGVEAKLFDFGAYKDWMNSLQVIGAFRF